jgi:hypothetical protein
MIGFGTDTNKSRRNCSNPRHIFLEDQREAAMGRVGAQRPVLLVIEPKKTSVHSAQARSAAKVQ